MRINGKAELTSDMWIYAIHSKNAELIKYLEDNQVPLDYYYNRILEESIKCHHNDVSKYIIDYLIKEKNLPNDIENEYYDKLYQYAIKYYNYSFFPENMKCKNLFFYFCKFDYYELVKIYLEEGIIDVNAKI
ncbi:hypothetical protein M9Y10_003728 [Tritrichomonas musculus]|uniref:Ankyrin repeat protein n=1 Tax=Tritrichomonas musculus TaxID=1915356 RepID=A0ABR2JQE8_9EUKA